MPQILPDGQNLATRVLLAPDAWLAGLADCQPDALSHERRHVRHANRPRALRAVRSDVSLVDAGAPTNGDILGFFEIHNKATGFTMADQEQLLAISHAASIAIQNALAYRRIQETEQALRARERTQRVVADISLIGERAPTRRIALDEMVQSMLELVTNELNVSAAGCRG